MNMTTKILNKIAKQIIYKKNYKVEFVQRCKAVQHSESLGGRRKA